MKNLLGTGNSKLKQTEKHFDVKILNFSIPAGNDKLTGKITCPFAAGCLKFCYAKKGFYRFSNVEKALSMRYNATKESNFEELIIDQIKKIKTNKQVYIRIHDSGDFYSLGYFYKWINIALKLPNIRFYAYTKSHSILRDAFIPENFDLIYSFGSKNDELINIDSERHTKIFNTVDELENSGYINSSKLDLLATKWFSQNNKVGLLIH